MATAGKGRPVVLIHGVCMSRRFFERNTGPLAGALPRHQRRPARPRRVARERGRPQVAQYAQDVKHLIDTLELDGAVLVGWSMGTFVIWDSCGSSAAPASPRTSTSRRARPTRRKDGWELGIFPLEELFGALEAVAGRLPRLHGALHAGDAHAPAERRRAGASCSARRSASAPTPARASCSTSRSRTTASSSRPTRCRRCSRGARREGRGRGQRPVARGRPARGRARRLRAVGPLPDVGGARALQPGRRRLDRARC